jgi:hypothetical protein
VCEPWWAARPKFLNCWAFYLDVASNKQDHLWTRRLPRCIKQAMPHLIQLSGFCLRDEPTQRECWEVTAGSLICI